MADTQLTLSLDPVAARGAIARAITDFEPGYDLVTGEDLPLDQPLAEEEHRSRLDEESNLRLAELASQAIAQEDPDEPFLALSGPATLNYIGIDVAHDGDGAAHGINISLWIDSPVDGFSAPLTHAVAPVWVERVSIDGELGGQTESLTEQLLAFLGTCVAELNNRLARDTVFYTAVLGTGRDTVVREVHEAYRTAGAGLISEDALDTLSVEASALLYPEHGGDQS